MGHGKLSIRKAIHFCAKQMEKWFSTGVAMVRSGEAIPLALPEKRSAAILYIRWLCYYYIFIRPLLKWVMGL